ncbi:MAG: hypothetical protein HRU75_04715 [Planctomycetia bacterium]|nr:MAG: hypothetical protein HRU75_04715 [Planctomycetia bacterium]
MAEFFSFLKVFVGCSTLLFLAMLILLALPASRLRTVGLELTKYAMVFGLVVLLCSPLDLLPGLPIDDLFYVIGAILTGRSALKDRESRHLFDEIEMAELRQRAKGAGDVHQN